MLGSSATPVEPGRRRPSKVGPAPLTKDAPLTKVGAAPLSKVGPLRIRDCGRSPLGQTDGSCPLNLSVREEEPLLQLVKKAPQPQAMPKEASEALLNLIAKTGRDLEITRKTRKAGEADLSERLRRGNLETSRNFSPIAPEVNLTELHPIVFPNRDHFPFHHDQFHNPDLKCAGGSDTSVPWEAAKEEVG